jgi:hypothetical protein
MEIGEIQQYYTLQAYPGVATLVAAGDSTEIQFKRFSPDTGAEMANELCHIPVSKNDLNDMISQYQAKIDLVQNLIDEINAL